jgi:hypothetical protein
VRIGGLRTKGIELDRVADMTVLGSNAAYRTLIADDPNLLPGQIRGVAFQFLVRSIDSIPSIPSTLSFF